MTPATTAAPSLAAADLPLTSQLVTVLHGILLGGSSTEWLRVTGRTQDGIDEAQDLWIAGRDFGPDLIPAALAKVIDEGEVCASVDLAVRTERGGPPRHVHALLAGWAWAPLTIGRRDGLPLEAIAAARAAIDAWSVRPAAVVLGGTPKGQLLTLTAVYRLDAPLSLPDADGLLGRLAARLGADPPRPASELSIAILGAPIRGVGAAWPVVALALDSSTHVSLAALAAALPERTQ